MSVTGVLTAKLTPDCLYSWRSFVWIISFPASTFTLAASTSIRFVRGVIISVPITWAWLPAWTLMFPCKDPNVLRPSDCVRPSDSTWCFSDFEPKVMPPPLVSTPDVFFVCWCTSLKWLVVAPISTSCPAWTWRLSSAIAWMPFAFTSWPAERSTSLPLTWVPRWLRDCTLSKRVFVVFAKLPLFVWWNSSKSLSTVAVPRTKSFSANAINLFLASNSAPADQISLPDKTTSPLPFTRDMRLSVTRSARMWLPPPIFSLKPTSKVPKLILFFAER